MIPIHGAHDPWPGLLEHLGSEENTVVTSAPLSHWKTITALPNLRRNGLDAIPEKYDKVQALEIDNPGLESLPTVPLTSCMTSGK